MATLRDKRRARRVASDEAHAWARSLQLGNASAKDVLKTLALYVDGDGKCFVGLDQLSADTDLSVDTVRRRMVWLEEIGAISRQRQWFDGRQRNGEGRGKQTSDLITLLLEADVDEIEARAAGRVVESEANSATISPSSVLGLNSGQGSLSPGAALAVVPGANPSNLEPESPLKSPQGDESEPIEVIEPEHFAVAWEAWPDHQGMRRDLALEEFSKLPPDKQRLCRAAIPHFVKMRKHMGRDHFPNFHIWIRSAGFNEFPTAVLDESSGQASTSFDVASREGRAIKALFAFARTSIFESRGRIVYSLPMTARVLAFAELPDPREWVVVDAPGQLAAWSAFLSAHINKARPDLGKSFRAPWPWPPRKDGSISGNGEAA